MPALRRRAAQELIPLLKNAHERLATTYAPAPIPAAQRKETGVDFNSGYTSDPFTQKVIAHRKDYPQLEKYLRTKWSTLRVEKQKKLPEFESEGGQ